jgi:hypothetical protein
MKRILPTLLLLAGLAPLAAQADACAGAPRCYDAGPFAAEVTSLSPNWNDRHSQHFLRLNLRFRNTGDRPLILGLPYAGSASITDNYANVYGINWSDTNSSVVSIGLIKGGSADTSFVIGPGASRSASLVFNRWLGRSGSAAAVGNQFTVDVSVEQLQVLPGSGRVQQAGRYSLNFEGLSGGAFGNLGSAGSAGGDDVVQGVGVLLNVLSNRKKH